MLTRPSRHLAGALAPKCKVSFADKLWLVPNDSGWPPTLSMTAGWIKQNCAVEGHQGPGTSYEAMSLVLQQKYAMLVVSTLQALRDGKVKSMDAVDIVPGDVLIVRLGDIMPADIKILGEEGDEDQAPMQVGPARAAGAACCLRHLMWSYLSCNRFSTTGHTTSLPGSPGFPGFQSIHSQDDCRCIIKPPLPGDVAAGPAVAIRSFVNKQVVLQAFAK